MGSSITIVNNTPDEWLCKVSPDEKALKIGYLATFGVSAFIGAFSLLGAFGPHLLGLSAEAEAVTGPVESVFGFKTEAFKKFAKRVEVGGAFTAVGTGAAVTGIIATRTIEDGFLSRHFISISSGGHHRWDKMPPYFWRQCRCIRSYALNESAVRTESILMRPIFSGSIKHDSQQRLADWIRRLNGTSHEDIVPLVDTDEEDDENANQKLATGKGQEPLNMTNQPLPLVPPETITNINQNMNVTT
uniref:Uncharacterized protein AlNc14C374G11148 n=1 Tax=Albugo laibachii Nc14 TaxID=890382 RepID=F0WY88_9STRA|nr:conserved hypothetical protein [Albugo laibachii Nc14]|eukprot:CCA26440.1 conserved hypothetical protein [Albugo laibachii Nc14]